MTPLRAIALLANPDSPGFSSALTTLTELDVNALSSHEQVSLLAALDAAVQALQPQHTALVEQLQQLRTAAQHVRAYQS